ncbi:MAG: helicase, partial [Deltaproteobacteria bacterium]|nr:helicase [Deltaproteobacteria bacterium]
GACFYSLQHEVPARLDFYRARVVDGLGNVIHERLFAAEIRDVEDPRLVEAGILGNFTPAEPPKQLPQVATIPEAATWLNQHALTPFLNEVREERLSEVDRIAAHIELSLTELIQKADEEIGRAAAEIEKKVPGAEGRLAQAETRHSELMERREKRRQELERQRALSLQAVERIASVLVLPHPEREAPDVKRLRQDTETEKIAMEVVIEYEKAQNRQVYDVHEKNLGYDITSLDLTNAASPKTAATATGSTLSPIAILRLNFRNPSKTPPASPGMK